MKKGHFLWKKGTKNLTHPYSIPFLSVLHQNKALYNFHKKGQRSIVEYNIGLEYAKDNKSKCSEFSELFSIILSQNFQNLTISQTMTLI